MNAPRHLLIFDLNEARYCFDAMQVRESVWLPELTPIEEAPPYVAGIFSLRGQIVPVVDLNLRFGHAPTPYRLSDHVVILELDQLLMGFIVSEVREVVELPAGAIQPPPQYSAKTHQHTHLIAGEARVGDNLVTLLDAGQLINQLQELAEADTEQLTPARQFCPQATPEERAVYRARAKALMESAAEETSTHLPLAVVEMGGEYFGIELQTVQEFCDITDPAPIPCCPPHIPGAISLRGNLLTLLDPRAALNLAPAPQNGGMAVIVRTSNWRGEQSVGVVVDKVHDVIYLQQQELQDAPASLRAQHGAEIRGTAPYGGRMMAVLDLPALLAREEWTVNETA